MNALMQPFARSATKMIKSDHEMVLALFHKLDANTTPPVRQALIRRICTALDIHARLEEEIFYPALRDAHIDSPALDKSPAEHEQMRSLIERLRAGAGDAASLSEGMPPVATGDGATGNDLVCELQNIVMHHVADEETIVLPQAERLLAADRLAELGARMQSRRMELARPHAGEMGADLVRSAPGRTALAATAAVVVGAWWMLGRMRHHRNGRGVPIVHR